MSPEQMQQLDDQLFELLLRTTRQRRHGHLLAAFAFGSLTAICVPVTLLRLDGGLYGVIMGGGAALDRWRLARPLGKVAGSPLAAALRRAGDPLVSAAIRLRAYGGKGIIVRFADNAGNSLDLLVPNDRIAALREAMGRRYPAARVDLDRDVALPPRAVARLGTGSAADD